MTSSLQRMFNLAKAGPRSQRNDVLPVGREANLRLRDDRAGKLVAAVVGEMVGG